jgi:hypothetical protein
MDVRRLGGAARINEKLSSWSLKNKDPEQFFIRLFIVPLYVPNVYCKAHRHATSWLLKSQYFALWPDWFSSSQDHPRVTWTCKLLNIINVRWKLHFFLLHCLKANWDFRFKYAVLFKIKYVFSRKNGDGKRANLCVSEVFEKIFSPWLGHCVVRNIIPTYARNLLPQFCSPKIETVSSTNQTASFYGRPRHIFSPLWKYVFYRCRHKGIFLCLCFCSYELL